MAIADPGPTRDYILGMLAIAGHSTVPFAWHKVIITAYSADEALYSAIVRVMGEYDDPMGDHITLRTVYIQALNARTVDEAEEVVTKAFVRLLPTRGLVA